MLRWVSRLTSGLIWLGFILILVGFAMWWRETREVAVLPDEATLIAAAPAPEAPETAAEEHDPARSGALAAPEIMPAFDEAEIPAGALDEPIATAEPPASFTPAPTATPVPAATGTALPVLETAPTVAVIETPVPLAPAPEPPTRLVAPAIGLDTPVTVMGWEVVQDENGNSYSDWIVPGYAAGWHMNSAMVGQPGNIVLSGHHNIEGEIFRYIVDLNPGDQLVLYAGDRPHRYEVKEKVILPEKGQPLEVRLRNAEYIAPTADNRLTLVTCWPYSTNTHRVVVVAKPLDAPVEVHNVTE